MDKFQQDLLIGKEGETKVINFLWSLDTTLKVMDVSDDPWFWQYDIDLLVQRKDLSIDKYEIKTDTLASKTNNIVYEIYSSKYKGSQGCFEKTQSDYLCYYIINTEYLLVFDTLLLREWVEIHSNELRYVDMGDSAEGYLIPINKVKEIAIWKGKI